MGGFGAVFPGGGWAQEVYREPECHHLERGPSVLRTALGPTQGNWSNGHLECLPKSMKVQLLQMLE